MAPRKPAAGSAAPSPPPVPQAVAELAAARVEFAASLFIDMARLRMQLFAPTVEKKPMVVDGTLVIAEVELDEPSFQSKRLIVASIAQGIEKVMDLAGREVGEDGEDDWTAPAGTTSIRDAKGRNKRHVRPTGS